MIFLWIAAGLAGAVVAWLLAVGLWPGIKADEIPLAAARTAGPEEKTAAFTEVEFESGGQCLAGRLFLPAGQGPFPCLVMAHGFGGVMEMGLAGYARMFTGHGVAALCFDYRHFGKSQGRPRHLVWIPRQIEDIAAALALARSHPLLNPERIGLWGTSLGGGHALTVAARDQALACVILQVPALDGRAAALAAARRLGWRGMFRRVVHAQRDLARSWLGLGAHMIPLVGRPGQLALMNEPGAFEAFSALAPAGYMNQVAARVALRFDKYRPLEQAGRVRCPALILACEQDPYAPLESVKKAAALMGAKAKLITYPCRHFEIYGGQLFEQAAGAQVEFIGKYLRD